jgi:hypothetical protein
MGTIRRGKEHASDRPSWPDEGGTDSTTIPSYWPEAKTEAVLAEAARPSWVDGPPGRPEPLWERWYERAIEEGVDEELASLGRNVMRMAFDRLWDEELRAECGLLDEGEAMLDLAMYAPDRAEVHWRTLLEQS